MRKGGGRIIAILVIGLVLVAVGRGGRLRLVQNAIGGVANPVGGFFWNVGSKTSTFFRVIPAVKDLSARNATLEHEVAALRERLAADAELRTQNEALRRQLNFSELAPRQLIPAEIIAYQPDNFRSFITIGRGRRDGIADNMAVISEGSLIGKVTETNESTSKVFLLIDPDFKVGALVQNEGRATGTVRGQVGGGLLMEKIAQDQIVHPGDAIITSGLGGDLPKGLILGRVESVNRQDNAVFQTAQLSSIVKFSQLELVFVVKQ